MNDARRPMLFDPGWLFLAAGLMLVGATLLIPASEELAEARWMRDRALLIEQERMARLTRHEEYLAALERRETSLVMSLVASQLHKLPADRKPIPGLIPAANASASVFPALEPEPVVLPESRVKVDSMLGRWTTDEGLRPWLLAGGALLMLIGLLPPSRPRA